MVVEPPVANVMKLCRITGFESPAGAFVETVNFGKGTLLAGSAPVLKLTVVPFVIWPPVLVCANMLYSVLAYMPATSNVIVFGGWQETQFVTEAGTPPDCSWKETRIVLPLGQDGALNKATSG